MNNEIDKVPIVLMVSGGSDSTALLEIVVRYMRGSSTVSFKLDSETAAHYELIAKVGEELAPPEQIVLKVLHVNHLLRGDQAFADEEFVVGHCRNLGVPCEVRRVDVGALAASSKEGMEAVAREVRYACADEVLDSLCADKGIAPEKGLICTAHTIDDRVETFLMRTLVGTGPGGLASIPRKQGRVIRPLIECTREQLRQWLRFRHSGCSDYELWRDDPTNDDGSNFRSQVRTKLVPVMRDLRPNFERSLMRTMDLIEQENRDLDCEAQSLVYRNLSWDGEVARFPLKAFEVCSLSMRRRVLRLLLLVVNPDARLESSQIERVLDAMATAGYSTEVSGGIRVRIDGETLIALKAQ